MVLDDVKVVDVSGSLWIQVGQHGRQSTQNEPKKQRYSTQHSKYGKPFFW